MKDKSRILWKINEFLSDSELSSLSILWSIPFGRKRV